DQVVELVEAPARGESAPLLDEATFVACALADERLVCEREPLELRVGLLLDLAEPPDVRREPADGARVEVGADAERRPQPAAKRLPGEPVALELERRALALPLDRPLAGTPL